MLNTKPLGALETIDSDKRLSWSNSPTASPGATVEIKIGGSDLFAVAAKQVRASLG